MAAAVSAARLLPQLPRLRESAVHHRIGIGRRFLCQVAAKQETAISEDSKCLDFIPWLMSRSEGGDISRVRIELSSEGTQGRGLFTTGPMAVDDRVMQIPPSLMLTQRDLPEEFDKVLHSSVKELTKLAYVILVERSKGKSSAWAPYMSFLPPPGELPCSIFWKPEELRFMGESPLGKRTSNRLEMMTAEFDKSLPVSALWPRYFGHGLSFQEFKHAYATVLSRVFSVDDTLALVPVLDVANHHPPVAAKLVYDKPTKSAVIKATKEYTEGEQVFISYGELSNADLALDFGFVIPNNPYDEVELFTQIPATHPLQKIKTEVTKQFGESAFFVREVRSGSIPKQLLATVLHIGASQDPELKKLVQRYGGKNITLGAKRLLSTFIDPQMSRLDGAFLALNERLPESYRKDMANHVIFGELKILHSAKNWFETDDLN